MRWLFVLVASLGGLALDPTLAPAWAESLAGEVVATQSRWVEHGSRIVTSVTVRGDDGTLTVVQQLGGSVDGVKMQVPHTAPIPAVGAYVFAELGPRIGNARWLTDLSIATPVFSPARTTQSLRPLRWRSGCVFITYHEDGTDQIAGNDEFQVMNGVFSNWRSASESCGYMEFRFEAPARPDAAYDGVNAVLFRRDRWCTPASEDVPEICHDPDRQGMTTLFTVDDPESERDAEILDADIELNNVHFATSIDGETLGTSWCRADLANTLTHEVGHLFGLAHASDPYATMYAKTFCGETEKATLKPDDISGVCETYPLSLAPGTCDPVTVVAAPTMPVDTHSLGNAIGGCSAAGEQGYPTWCLTLVCLLFLGRTRKATKK